MKFGKLEAVLLIMTIAFGVIVAFGLLDEGTLQWEGNLLYTDRLDTAIVSGPSSSMTFNMTGARQLKMHTLFTVLTTLGAYVLFSELYSRRGKLT